MNRYTIYVKKVVIHVTASNEEYAIRHIPVKALKEENCFIKDEDAYEGYPLWYMTSFNHKENYMDITPILLQGTTMH